jgi:hypothetical protein
VTVVVEAVTVVVEAVTVVVEAVTVSNKQYNQLHRFGVCFRF